MFLQNYYNNFSKEKFAENISLENFKTYSTEFKKISSSSSLRNVFDSYYKIYDLHKNNNKNEEFEIEKEILFAKIAYQEQRGILPSNKWNNRTRTEEKDSFTEFLRGIYNKLEDPKKFKQFLEVFVAYHKFFNPNAK